MKRNLTVALLLMSLIFMLTGCGSTKEKKYVKGTIADLEYAANHYDVQEILNIIDPDISGPIKLLYGFGAFLTESDKDDMAENIVNLFFGSLHSLGVSDNITSKLFLENIKIEPVKYKIKGKSGKVYCRITLQSMDQSFIKFAEVEVVKLDGKWYIESFRLLSTREASEYVD